MIFTMLISAFACQKPNEAPNEKSEANETNQTNEIDEPDHTDEGAIIPVSYTHLDVYKRQNLS